MSKMKVVAITDYKKTQVMEIVGYVKRPAW